MLEDRRPPLAPMVRKLMLWKKLSTDEQEAVLLLPYRLARLEPGDYIIKEGALAEQSCLLLSGFAYRQKLTQDGARSISARRIC